MIEYKRTKQFSTADIEKLFKSVKWFSGNFPDRLQQALQNSSIVISAWDSEKLVGLIRGLDDGVWQASIDCLLVHPDYQGRGIASALLRDMLEEYQDFLYISVVPEDKKNVAFYEKHGFKIMPDETPMQIIGKKWELPLPSKDS